MSVFLGAEVWARIAGIAPIDISLAGDNALVIAAADGTMSLDNVPAVAAAARLGWWWPRGAPRVGAEPESA
jgi:predicted tellurium resistance membrane protein TerC